MRARWVLAGAAALFYLVALPIDLVIERASGWYGGSLQEAATFEPGLLATFVVGWLFVLRRAGGVIGWLLVGNWLVLSLSVMISTYAGYAYGTGNDLPGARAAAIWDTHGWPLLFAGIVAIAFVVPDGRLPSRRWRAVAWFGAAAFTVTTVGGLTSSEALDHPFQDVEPWGVLSGPVAWPCSSLGLLGMIVTLLLAAVSLALRYRRADVTGKRQLKWIALAGLLIPVAIISSSLDPAPESSGPATWLPFCLVLVAVPVSIGVAVLRYRLYDVDQVVATTAVYVVLTALLAAGFVAVILLGGVLLGGGSPITTAAATLGVAVAFRPVRSLVQGARRAHVQPPALVGAGGRGRLPRRPARRPTRTRGGGGGAGRGRRRRDAPPLLLAADPGGPRRRHRHAGARAARSSPGAARPCAAATCCSATVLHADRAGVRRELAHLLVRAGLAIEIARLRVEVLRQLAEVEGSRSRIVTAALDERRRLERDLHDGAQQQLVAIGLDLRHVQAGLDPGDPLQGQLDDSVRRLGDAVRELRELARGVRPSTLDAGLASALSELAGRSPVRTVLDVTAERFPAEVEAAAYFVVARHSPTRSNTRRRRSSRCSPTGWTDASSSPSPTTAREEPLPCPAAGWRAWVTGSRRSAGS